MDQLQGVYTTLAEYTSREARFNLVQLCLDHLETQSQTSNVAATKALADRLYVSQRTIQRWARGGIQSCNVNAEAIINVALGMNLEEAAKVLVKDLEEHRQQLEATLPPGQFRAEEVLMISDDTPVSPSCVKCGEPEDNTRNLDEHGICDMCAGRAWVPDPVWCTQFRNIDGSQPYCSESYLKASNQCEKCPVYQENLRAEEQLRSQEPELDPDTCPHCGKTSPNPNYCTSCGKAMDQAPEMGSDTQATLPQGLAVGDRDTGANLEEELNRALGMPPSPETEDPVAYVYLVKNRETGEEKKLEIKATHLMSRYGEIDTPTQMFVKDLACRLELFGPGSWKYYQQLSCRKIQEYDVTQDPEPQIQEVA